ncbi:MAG: chorismate mutase [Alphaproteobacteria bacterium]|nr:chorismate mutase [Alphaproteobacteria bacterium]
MTGTNDALTALRQEIDEIDAELHKLFMRRAEVVENVGRAKGRTKTAVFAPGREAMVLRKLLARHDGRLPPQSLLRIWREMMPAYASMQAPMPIAVFATEDNRRCWDLARDHFGSYVPITAYDSAAAVIEQVTSGAAVVGVLPAPDSDCATSTETGDSDEDDAPWWRGLCEQDRPCVVSSLPFAAGSNAWAGPCDAYAVARITPDATGDDKSLVCVTALDADAALEALASAGLSGRRIASDGADFHMVEVDEFLTTDDARIAALANTATVIGAYASPAHDLIRS